MTAELDPDEAPANIQKRIVFGAAKSRCGSLLRTLTTESVMPAVGPSQAFLVNGINPSMPFSRAAISFSIRILLIVEKLKSFPGLSDPRVIIKVHVYA